MAIANVALVRIVGLKREQNKIIDALTENGLFEARATDALPFGDAGCNAVDAYKDLKLKQSRIAFALDFLKTRHAKMRAALDRNAKDVKRGKARPIDFELSSVKYSSGRTLITKADFSDAAAKEYELMHVVDELEKLSFQMTDCTSRANTIKSAISAYEPYAGVPFTLSELRKGSIFISVYGGGSGDIAAALDPLFCAYEARGGVVITVCRAADADGVDKALSALGYSVCPFSDECTAAQKISALEQEGADIDRQIFELEKKALGYEKYVKELRILYDCVGLDIERNEAEQKFVKTDSAFVLEGWLPEAAAEKTRAELAEKFPTALIQLLAPEDRDAPPTLVVNNKVVKPYEQITDMYSPPHYREIDPNPIMAVFYFLFFGIMIGDAGYGLILAVAGLAIGTSKRFDNGVKRLALLVGMGGISAIFWGVMFGGYFSIEFGETNVAVLLNPLDKPLLLLVISIGFGCLQLVVGFIIKFVALCKDGKPFSAIFDCGSIILLFAALVCLVISMLPSLAPMLGITVGFTPPKGFSTAALVLALCGVALILIFGGRNSKNVFGKVIGGFKGLYGLVNILSDLLSYCRLFGLCLASCAIGLAFNRLGGIIMDIPIAGYVLGAIVLAVLHTFNLALGVLSAYVHDARLQFLEFYGKFYAGGGRLFSPLGSKTKYIRYN